MAVGLWWMWPFKPSTTFSPQETHIPFTTLLSMLILKWRKCCLFVCFIMAYTLKNNFTSWLWIIINTLTFQSNRVKLATINCCMPCCLEVNCINGRLTFWSLSIRHICTDKKSLPLWVSCYSQSWNILLSVNKCINQRVTFPTDLFCV